MLTTPSIINAQITMTDNFATVSPLQLTLPVKFPISFASVANLQTITGSYTPANDVHVIVNGISAISPNFIFFVCDGQASLTTDNNFLNAMPINRVGFFTMIPIVGGGNAISAMSLDGRTSGFPGFYPMPQGIQLNYTLVYGQAIIS